MICRVLEDFGEGKRSTFDVVDDVIIPIAATPRQGGGGGGGRPEDVEGRSAPLAGWPQSNRPEHSWYHPWYPLCLAEPDLPHQRAR